MELEVKEAKVLVLKRVPPGDRWQFVDTKVNPKIYTSLTDGLEAWYQHSGETNFYMEARKGTVHIVMEEQVEVPIKKFSLYGED